MSASATLQILQELGQLRLRVTALEERFHLQAMPWLTAAEMGKLCGLNKRTLLRYAAIGALSPESVRKVPRAGGQTYLYRFHRENTLRDLGRA